MERVTIKNEYKKTIAHIRNNKKIIYFAGMIYLSFFILGLFQPFFSEEIRAITIPDSISSLEIFYHNLQINVVGKLLLGITIIIPSLILAVNGYIIGFSVIDNLSSFLNPLFTIGFILIGFLELSIGFIMAGLGIRFGVLVFTGQFRKSFEFLKENIRVALLIITPVLFFSAFFENYLIHLIKGVVS